MKTSFGVFLFTSLAVTSVAVSQVNRPPAVETRDTQALIGVPTATVESAVLEYKIGDGTFEGYLARPKTEGPVPGVLIVHDWTGNGEFSQNKAREVAALGYAAFAVDMYGKGIRAPGDQKAAAELAAPFYQDRSLFRARITAALEELKKQKGIDANKIGVMGFCFGGTTALELARSGAEIKAAVSFHGGLATPTPAEAKNIKAKLLILHGNLDPVVPPKDVASFMEEMNAARVSYRFVGYPNAVHSFTNPKAGTDVTKASAYDPDAAKQSFEEMKRFFQATLE